MNEYLIAVLIVCCLQVIPRYEDWHGGLVLAPAGLNRTPLETVYFAASADGEKTEPATPHRKREARKKAR